ncbi:MAG TPA: hypothetical protein VF437_02345 [Verrucomicrobiae bacterium]|jgi:hypothetical protein
MLKKFLPILLLPLLLAGCTSTLTNLSAQRQSRNADNLYPVEVAFKSSQQSLRWETIQPYIKVNGQLLPMRPTPLMTNRWEGLIPVPAGAREVDYQYKLDFQFYRLDKQFGTPQTDSVRSHTYKLQILDQ